MVVSPPRDMPTTALACGRQLANAASDVDGVGLGVQLPLGVRLRARRSDRGPGGRWPRAVGRGPGRRCPRCGRSGTPRAGAPARARRPARRGRSSGDPGATSTETRADGRGVRGMVCRTPRRSRGTTRTRRTRCGRPLLVPSSTGTRDLRPLRLAPPMTLLGWPARRRPDWAGRGARSSRRSTACPRTSVRAGALRWWCGLRVLRTRIVGGRGLLSRGRADPWSAGEGPWVAPGAGRRRVRALPRRGSRARPHVPTPRRGRLMAKPVLTRACQPAGSRTPPLATSSATGRGPSGPST